MTRGGAVKDRTEPERRCIATGVSGPTDRLIRFVLGPGGEVVPDIAGRLPGRGIWLTADRALVEKAVAKRLFARAFRKAATAPADLADRLEALLAKMLIETIGLARKAGQAVTGFEKVRARLQSGGAGVLVQASDAAPDGKGKLARIAGGTPVVDVLGSQELGLAFGRDFAIHAALDRGGFADRVILEAARLGGLRSAGTTTEETRCGAAGTDDMKTSGAGSAPGQGDR